MTTGDRIKALRKSKGMTHDELAQKLGYSSKTSITRMEKGYHQISNKVAETLADIFDVSPAYILGYDDNIDLTHDLNQIEKLANVLHEDQVVGTIKYTDAQLNEILQYARYVGIQKK